MNCAFYSGLGPGGKDFLHAVLKEKIGEEAAGKPPPLKATNLRIGLKLMEDQAFQHWLFRDIPEYGGQ